MKIAMAQINTTVGAFEDNFEKIKGFYHEATKQGADIVVFPELAVCGYPPRDLVDLAEFRHQNDLIVARIVAMTIGHDSMVVVGALHTDGKETHNSAYAIYGGVIAQRHDKMLLPTYDVFDEWRNFTAGRCAMPFIFKGMKLGLTVCEDIWNNEPFLQAHKEQKPYEFDPVRDLSQLGVELVINVSASPYTIGKTKIRKELLENTANFNSVAIVYCNAVGGNDSLVFDGNSMAFDGWGHLVATCPSFREDLAFVDFDLGEFESVSGTKNPQITDPCEEIWEALKLGTRDYIHKCGFSNVVIGLSGGIDSALVAAIAVSALGSEHVVGITMPSEYSSGGSISDSFALAKNLGIKLYQIPIQRVKEQFQVAFGTATIPPGNERDALQITGVADENLQARIRGTMLMSYSNQTGAMVLTTANKSESAVGYSTLYGDMCGGLAVIADVPKTTVYHLARWINENVAKLIPESTINKAPSAELAPGQLDSNSLPPYDVLDPIIHAYVEDRMNALEISEAQGAPLETVTKVLRLIDRAEYKRQQAAPTLKVTSKAWYGRNLPIARK